MDKIGRKYSICIWSAVLSIGNAFQVGSQYPYWEVMLIGRIVAGLGVGGLLVVTPAFTCESAPAHIRAATVSCYNLFVTFGQVVANLVNFGTNELTGTVQWRPPIGLGWVWCLALGGGVLLFPDTPRHDFRHGRVDRAANTMAGYYMLAEMQAKLQIEEESKAGFMDIFTAPRMLYRVLLGCAVMAIQQLAGNNFFVYFGTSLFTSVGIPNPFVTAIILGVVNCVGTIPGLYLVEQFGRRRCLTIGASSNCIMFLIYASLGQFALTNSDGTNDQIIGYLMIVFACLFIFVFAATWGPMAWTVISEIFPSQFRSVGISLSCTSVWIFNFYIAFSTSFVVNAIGFAYGYFFAACAISLSH
ncbi:Putative major facilitator, sugar transporter, major facilitator superfamily [Septoria linicola]|uniref:Major facilitator, sugar transporter, major facilitator superfamily n=1 Tax=Septoria linicola TaxID=215465 RepID=A0A9Q9EPY9_9PEZI|nr:Putative major facilitator, sugar transporter, major facilitator superfamily [Septoria linicola]